MFNLCKSRRQFISTQQMLHIALTLILLLICSTKTQQCTVVQSCVELNYYGCIICYSQCELTNTNEQQILLVFNSCKQNNCSRYGEELNRNCQQDIQNVYDQQTCLSQCCNINNINNNLTLQLINQCASLNQQQIDNAQVIKIIVIVSVAACLVLSCIIAIFCDKYDLWHKCKKKVKKKCVKVKSQQQQQNNNGLEIDDQHHRQILHHIHQCRTLPLGALLREAKWTQCASQYINTNDQCSICLHNNNNSLTYCSHSFHLQCLLLWIRKRSLCPLCNSTSYNPIQIICQSCHKMKISVSIDRYTPELIYSDIQCCSCEKRELLQRKRMIQLNDSSMGFNHK